MKTRNDSIINLTQHSASAEQVEAGVVEPSEGQIDKFSEDGEFIGSFKRGKQVVCDLLTFPAIPVPGEMQLRAGQLAEIALESGCKKAMIGGAPFFMSALEHSLIAAGITPLFAFSERVSEEQPQPDGSVRKINLFRHVGFVSVS